MPVVRPLNVQLVIVVEHVKPLGLDVTVYPVMAAPPLLVGAVQLMEAAWAPLVAVAEAPVGAPGTVAGVAGGDAAEVGPLPAPLVATTVKV